MGYFSEADARSIIRDAYARVAPGTSAVAELLYTADEIGRLPGGAVGLALGVGHPVRHAALARGETVLDLGCGGGIDSLLAALAVGPLGKVIGLDMTPEMLELARQHAKQMGMPHVEFREALIEDIPLPDGSVDVVVANGALNLSTRQSRTLAEMMRVVRPGGRIAVADLVITEALPEAVLRSPAALAG